MGSVTPSRLTAELLGTAVLVFFGVGALVTGGSLLAAAIGLMLAAAAAAWIFGGHFNPWLTLASAVRGSMDWLGAVAVIVAQLVGGVVGGLLMWLAYGDNGVQAGLGANRLAEAASSGKGLVAAIAAEALAVFVLACAMFALGDGERAGFGLGAVYAVGTLAIAAVTSASLNLARTIGPELTLTIAGGKSDWSDLWVFAVSGAIGAVLAGLLYPRLRPAAK
ncbi:aquaporin [Catellatospora tritici]|uniref:aquaporin n=1 Tax=Catellatospora tritici TaxID=2851566 RepID=UPI001C2D9558|nr:aquaporin [Catellatospora tritici]MBV1848759.1 aquaporin [Catellatospora tritici]